MRKYIFSLCIGMLSIGLVACGTGDEQTGSNPSEPEDIETPEEQPSDDEEEVIDEGEWESLKFDLETTEQEGKLDVQMTLTNEGSEDMTLTFSSGQRFEIILLDQNQAEVYRYSADKMFTMALEQEELKAGQDISFTEAIDVSEFDSGSYEVVATLVLYEINGQEVTDSHGLIESTETVEIGQ